MSTHRHIDIICIVILIFSLLLTVLFMNGEALGIEAIVDEDAESYSGSVDFTKNDRDGSWDTANATSIRLTGSGAEISGSGAYVLGSDVVISAKGRYVLSGTLDDGSIVVDASSGAKVWIMLDGAEIRCSDGAALLIEQADKVFLTLAEGTENTLTGSFGERAEADGITGTVFARDDLTVNGSGSLTVVSNTEHGFDARDRLVITGGSLRIEATKDALHVNDSLHIEEATLSLEAGDDGISVGREDSDLLLASGTVEIQAADKGISAAGTVLITGGVLSIESEDDGIHAAGDVTVTDGSVTVSSGDDGIHSDTAIAVSGGSIRIPACYEGLEAVTIDVSGGDIVIYPEDDGLNANGGSDGFGNFGGGMPGGGFGGGMHGGHRNRDGETEDGTEQPEDGAFPDFGEMPEWPEDGEMPDFADGEFPEPPDFGDMPEFGEWPEDGKLPDFDGQSDTSEMPQDGEERPEPPEMPEGAEAQGERPKTETDGDTDSDESESDSETWIHVSGGSITVINETARDADGLDSNGDIIITGGVIRVSLVNAGSNSALDYGSENGGVMEISGGEVIACGSYSMAESFDSTSTQCSILYVYQQGADAGTTVMLEDADGNVLLSYEVPCSFSALTISTPEMKIGETYTVVIGDDAEEITLEEVSASFGDAQSGGFGGPMNWGGMQPRSGGFGGGRPDGMRPGGAWGNGEAASGNDEEASVEQGQDTAVVSDGDGQELPEQFRSRQNADSAQNTEKSS